MISSTNCCDIARRYWTTVAATYGVRVVAPANEEPFLPSDVWDHLRIDVFDSPPATADDAWLSDIGIPASRAWAEAYCAISVAVQTLELAGRGFPTDSAQAIQLPFGPVRGVNSVLYIDGDGVEQSFTDFELNAYTSPALLRPAFGFSWPTARDQDRSVRIEYEAGYSDDSPATPMPPNVRIGMLLMLGHLYENREDATSVDILRIPNGARTFLDFHRARFGFA